jgi:hypothetical protein
MLKIKQCISSFVEMHCFCRQHLKAKDNERQDDEWVFVFSVIFGFQMLKIKQMISSFVEMHYFIISI